ncbi:MAG: NADH:ubiquinone oxidoreductase [Rhodospirillales bacterium]|nr:NADH:ubiquinone oxidoreductase [Rhodospirillales bacterium]
MPISLFWVQCGGCGGDSISFLNAESPNFVEVLKGAGIRLLWHPSLSDATIGERRALVERLRQGEEALDILVVEGSIVRGPSSTGMYDTHEGRPKKDLVAALARRARFVVALGTCASFGGIGVDGPIEASGLQFRRCEPGGLLGADFRAASGLPVVNLAGCPCHPEVLAGTLMALAVDVRLEMDEFNRPLAWYGMTVHQGCTRNEYHEYRIEEEDFGQKGCLFFHKGCHGPLVGGPCNKLLWNRRSSKTRAGVPCFGCTSPEFPTVDPFFFTRNIEGVPTALPNGIIRSHYLVYKTMAAAAAPERLKNRKAEI